MTASFISLASILFGIIGANLSGVIFKKYSFGFTGNTIIGVFGSILFIKSLGRIGIDPKLILESGNVDYTFLTLNFLISFLGGSIALVLGWKLKGKFNKERTN